MGSGVDLWDGLYSVAKRGQRKVSSNDLERQPDGHRTGHLGAPSAALNGLRASFLDAGECSWAYSGPGLGPGCIVRGGSLSS